MTTKEMTKLGRHYMSLLGMVEWMEHAEFSMVRNLKDSDGTYLDGYSWWSVEERYLRVKMATGLSVEAQHCTLIHELLHVLLEGHKPPMVHDYDENYEWGLNRAAKAYYEAWKQ